MHGYADFLLVEIRVSYRWVPRNRVGAFILRSEFHPPIGRWCDIWGLTPRALSSTWCDGEDYTAGRCGLPADEGPARRHGCFRHGVVNRKGKDKERPQRYEINTPDLVSAASPPPRARKRPPPSTDTDKPFMSTGKKPFKSPKRSGIVVPAHLRVAYNGCEHDAWAVLDLGDGR